MLEAEGAEGAEDVEGADLPALHPPPHLTSLPSAVAHTLASLTLNAVRHQAYGKARLAACTERSLFVLHG